MSRQVETLKREIMEIGRRLYERGLIVATDGNISARLGDGKFLVTAAGSCKGYLTAEDLVCCDYLGRTAHSAPTSELPMHLAVYGLRTEVQAVIHAHPPMVIACSLAGLKFKDDTLPEVRLGIGRIGWARFAEPSTPEGAEVVSELITDCDAIVLARHGALTVGTSLWEAFYRMERLELVAQVFLLSHYKK